MKPFPDHNHQTTHQAATLAPPSRRGFTLALLGAAALLSVAPKRVLAAMGKAVDLTPLKLSRSEWQKRLSKEQFRVLRLAATEMPGSSELLKEKRVGTYHCAGCDLGLFESSAKYESGTGWPSFFDVIPGRIATETDYKLLFPRTEYHCARCGGHQGHLFKDGPKPTGQRWCNNGVALTFVPKSA